MAELRIDVWSDIACPWCYVGKRRLERALEDFPHASEVKVVWHSFELDPSAPRERDPQVSHVERIAKKYGISVAQLCIRYCLQLGLLPLPKSTSAEHIRDNAAVDFVISDEDMAALRDVGNRIDYGDASAFPVFGKKRQAG